MGTLHFVIPIKEPLEYDFLNLQSLGTDIQFRLLERSFIFFSVRRVDELQPNTA